MSGGSVSLPAEGVSLIPGSGGGGGSVTVADNTGDTITNVGTINFVGVKVSGSSPTAITNMTTITGADGSGTIAPQGVSLRAGTGVSGASSGYGGGIYGYAGSGYAHGGNVQFFGGDGGTTSTVTSPGGNLVFQAGNGAYPASSPGGYARFSAGTGRGANPGGNASVYGGGGVSTGNGGNAIVSAGGADSGAGGNVLINPGVGGAGAGTVQVNNDPSLIVASHSWVAGESLNGRTIFTTTRAMRVTAVIGRPDAVNGTAATLVVVKAASGTAPGGGTALTSTSMDLTGTANTNQTLTLSATPADLLLAPGDSLCMTTTGTLAASVGCITVWATPQ